MTSIKFIIHHKIKFGQAIYLANSSNGWLIDQNCRMNCFKQCKWELNIETRAEALEYKYVIGDYDAVIPENFIWENGSNRRIQISEDTPKVIKDKWERRKITLSFIKQCQKSMAIVLGNKKQILIPRKMKTGSGYHTQYFYLTVYLDLDELDQAISLQYYLLIYEQNPIEYVSQPISMVISDCNSSSQKLSFQRITFQ